MVTTESAPLLPLPGGGRKTVTKAVIEKPNRIAIVGNVIAIGSIRYLAGPPGKWKLRPSERRAWHRPWSPIEMMHAKSGLLPLGRFESALEDLLRRLCRRPGRWILIAEDNVRRHHFWQSLAFEDGSLVTETVSNHYLEGEDRWTPEEDRRLLALGWECPQPPRTTNWINVEYTTCPAVDEVAKRAAATVGIRTGTR